MVEIIHIQKKCCVKIIKNGEIKRSLVTSTNRMRKHQPVKCNKKLVQIDSKEVGKKYFFEVLFKNKYYKLAFLRAS